MKPGRRVDQLATALVLTVSLATSQALSSEPISIRAGTLLDGRGGTQEDVVVVVEGSRIADISATAASSTTYDLSELTLLPGLIEGHQHIGSYFSGSDMFGSDDSPEKRMSHALENAYVSLMGGVTTLQSVGAQSDLEVRDAIERGVLPGSRILTSAGIIYDGTPDEVRQRIRDLKTIGADLVKIVISGLLRDGGERTNTDEFIQAACEESKTLGLRSLVHAHNPPETRTAILAGCTQIEHGGFLTDEIFELMVEHGTYFGPNVGVLQQNYIENRDRFLALGFTDQHFARMNAVVPQILEMFKRALEHENLKIVLTADAVAGSHGRSADELIARVEKGGQHPMDAIISGTSLAAQAIGMQDSIGTLEPGKEADIIGVKGNPIEDITALSRVVFVMKGGRVYKYDP
ncbi:MAG: amidohydrolase family protein [Gammaproteobacteria bacterium]|nr:amidohydrolase family protein [Gammaproteobacteria bacterium]